MRPVTPLRRSEVVAGINARGCVLDKTGENRTLPVLQSNVGVSRRRGSDVGYGRKGGPGDPPAGGGLCPPVSCAAQAARRTGGGRPDERGDLRLRQGEVETQLLLEGAGGRPRAGRPGVRVPRSRETAPVRPAGRVAHSRRSGDRDVEV